MFSDDAMNKLYDNLTQEQISQLFYYFSNDGLPEFRKMLQKKVNTRFLLSMRRLSTIYLLQLGKDGRAKKETVNLLNQARKTIKHVHSTIKKNDIIDANVLLRSAFENLIMAIMINEDENVYNEFIDLSIDENTRKYTKVLQLRKGFKKVLKKFDDSVFSDISNTQLQDLLDELYDKMCLYTHSTLVVNALAKIENDNVMMLFTIFTKQNAYFIELLLYLCLKYLVGASTKSNILLYALIGWIMLMLDASHLKLETGDFDQIYDKLYGDNNRGFSSKYDKHLGQIRDGLVRLQNEIHSNADVLIDFLIEIMK